MRLEINEFKNYRHLYNEFYRAADEKPVYYDLAVIESIQELYQKKIHIAVLKNQRSIYALLPGWIFKNSFYSLNFRSFDNLQILIHSNHHNNCEIIYNFINQLNKRFRFIKLSNFKRNPIIESMAVCNQKSRTCPVIFLPSSLDEYLGSLSKSFRRHLQKDIRSANSYDLKIRIIKNDDIMFTQTIINRLYELHAERTQDKEIKSLFLWESSQLFHKSLMKAKKGNVLFTEVWQDDDCIGSLYGLVNSQSYAGISLGFKNSLHKISMGNLLFLETIKYLMKNGIYKFDFLRGKEK